MSGYYIAEKFSHRMIGMVPSVDFPVNRIMAVRIHDGVQVDTGVVGFGLPLLLTQLRDGLLSRHAGYAAAIGDDFITAVQVDTGFAGHRAATGLDKTTHLLPVDSLAANGMLTSDLFVLTAPTFLGVAYWDLFQLENSEDLTAEDTAVRQLFTEVDPAGLTVQVSTDGGVVWTTVTHGQPCVLPLGDQFRIRFENAGALSSERIWLGSWTFVYKT